MNFDDFRPILRNTRLYLDELEAFVDKFIPWQTLVRNELALLPSPDEEALRNAAEEIARRRPAQRCATAASTGKTRPLNSG